MIKKLFLLVAALSLYLFGGDGYIVSAPKGSLTPQKIEEVYVKHGFKPSENRDMNIPYMKEFGQTDFEVYNLYTYYHPEIAKKLMTKNPIAGIYIPQSMSMWVRKGEKEFHVAFLKASGMAATLGMDPNDPDLIALEKANIEVLKEAMPGAKFVETKFVTDTKKPGGPLITKFETKIDTNNPKASLEQFQSFFEGELEEKGFAIAGFNNFLEQEFQKANIDKFSFYSTYSICFLKVIYTVSKKTPEAGMYAPCSIVNYNVKGTDKMVIAYPSVWNWITALNITDKAAVDVLLEAQKKLENIIKTITQ